MCHFLVPGSVPGKPGFGLPLETRVRPIAGVDHVAVDLIVLYKVC